MVDIGLTHIALPVTEIERSIKFYSTYAGMEVIHRRTDAETGVAVVWLCDRTRPFVIVLIQTSSVHSVLSPLLILASVVKAGSSWMRFVSKQNRKVSYFKSQKILDIRSGIGLSCEIQTVIRLSYPMDKK